MDQAPAVAGVFDDPAQAQQAVADLRSAGFDQDAIDVKEPEGKLLEALLPEEERDRRTTVRVRADGRRLQAADILGRHGARDVDTGGSPTGPTSETSDRIPLLEEELVGRTVPVQTGEIRIRKRVVTETRIIEVPVRREEVVVERVPVPHAQSVLTEEDFQGDQTRLEPGEPISELGADQDITRIPVLEEQIVLHKRVVVREHVTVTKRVIEEVKQVSGTVRREEPRVQQEGRASVEDAGIRRSAKQKRSRGSTSTP